jgi:hypothetical protein
MGSKGKIKNTSEKGRSPKSMEDLWGRGELPSLLGLSAAPQNYLSV